MEALFITISIFALITWFACEDTTDLFNRFCRIMCIIVWLITLILIAE